MTRSISRNSTPSCNIGFDRDGKFIVKIDNIDIGCSYIEEWMKFGKPCFALGDSLEQAAKYPSWKDAFDALALACADGLLDEDEHQPWDPPWETQPLSVSIEPVEDYEIPLRKMPDHIRRDK